MMKPVLPGGWLSTFIAFVFTSRCCLSFKPDMGEDTKVSQGGSSKDGTANRDLALLYPKVWPLCCTWNPWKECSWSSRLRQGSPALGAEFGPSHNRSRAGVQPSSVRVKTQQHWTFHDKESSIPGETYFYVF